MSALLHSLPLAGMVSPETASTQDTVRTFAFLVLLLPLVGTIFISLTWKKLPGKSAGWIGTAFIAASFICALATLVNLQQINPTDLRQVTTTLWDYADTLGIDAKATLLIDPLSVLMILVVTGVSTLIHLYSVAYLWTDKGYARFFSYLNFFVFSMLLLVLAGNFFLLIVGWAFVGAASYLLISFWYRRTTATKAGMKAFVINVLGDVGLVLGTYFIFQGTGTLDFLATFAEIKHAFVINDSSLVAGCTLLLVGAFAKSAQVPLHTWLPDAMEGPTPVSALIHAATMVTAGVYLIARMHPLFQQAPAAADIGMIIGCVTLIIAATIGLVVTDLKRVIAYSTMSQIGYMIMAVSAGAYAAGMFHMMTHAFFKALLFMAAGSVIAAMAGTQSLNKMSGFKKAMPFTYGCFIIGGLALTGVPPFSGFFSKDEILFVIGSEGGWHWALYVIGYIGALMTAIYTFRMIFRAFHGTPCEEAKELEGGHLFHAKEHTNPANGEVEDTDVGFPGSEHHIAEREAPMKIAMTFLALAATIAGILQVPKVTEMMTTFLAPTFGEIHEVEGKDGLLYGGLALGAVVGLLGIWIAYVIWVKRPGTSAAIQAKLPWLHKFFVNKWYFDELIDTLFVRPTAWFGRFAQQKIERYFIDDAIVGGTTSLVKLGSAAVRSLQSGFLRIYAAILILGALVVVFYFLLNG